MKQLNRLFITAFFIGIGLNLAAQDSTQTNRNFSNSSAVSGNTHFLLAGYGYIGYEKKGKENSSFGPGGFAPIFLWKKSDRLFFETEAEFEIEDGKLNIGLEYATIHYKLAKNLTLGAGKFLSPFGIFGERLHPAWINKFAEKPLGFSHDAGGMIGPMTEFGFELRGGAQIGGSKINYVGYISNGPNLVEGVNNPMMAGMLQYDNFADNNNNKAIGGRIGFLPFANSSLEIGISGQYAKVGNQESNFKNIGARLSAIDLSVIQKIEPLNSNLDIKAQYNTVKVDKATYVKPSTQLYTFDNTSSAWFAQAALRPAFVENPFLKNLEFSARLSAVKTPVASLWAADKFQTALGINYWLDWNSVIKINFQRTKDRIAGEYENGFFILWGLGF